MKKAGRPFRDRTGEVWGHVHVRDRATDGPPGKLYWNCFCAACGRDFKAWANGLNRGRRSCGCLAMNPKGGPSRPGTAGRTRISAYRSAAQKRGHVWELSEEAAVALFDAQCHYCAAPPRPRNGIDRVDNALGYTPENCVSACMMCNRAKNVFTTEEFLAWVRRVAAHNTPRVEAYESPDLILAWYNDAGA